MGTLLYLSTDQGVVTVTNAGEAWVVDSQSLRGWNVNEVAVLPSAPHRAYAATRGDGVWRSDDYGQSWTKPNRSRLGPGKVKCVTIDPHDPDTVYAGGEPIELWVSHDAGETWTTIDSVREFPGIEAIDYPVQAVEPHIRDIVIDAKDRGTMYLNLQVGYLLKTTDHGATWKLLNKDVDADAHTLVSRSDDPNRLYLSTGGHDYRLGTTPGRSLYRSNDGGESWLPMAMEFEQEYSVPLIADPQNEDVLYSAVANGNPGTWSKQPEGARASLIRSTDAGETWHELPATTEIRCGYAEAIALDPEEPERVFVATRDGRLFGSLDAGGSWESLGVQLTAVADMRAVHV